MRFFFSLIPGAIKCEFQFFRIYFEMFHFIAKVTKWILVLHFQSPWTNCDNHSHCTIFFTRSVWKMCEAFVWEEYKKTHPNDKYRQETFVSLPWFMHTYFVYFIFCFCIFLHRLHNLFTIFVKIIQMERKEKENGKKEDKEEDKNFMNNEESNLFHRSKVIS